MTIREKYEIEKGRCGKYGRVFIHRGIPNGTGGYFVPPKTDPDYDDEIPLIRMFAIMPKTAQVRLVHLKEQGWEEFKPEPVPEAVKKADETKTRSRKTGTVKAKEDGGKMVVADK